uniref:Structural protein n=1 Tax=Avastrovirus 2 TaxID=1239438 RepID=A0A3G1RP80_9VIRU|nr:MAG: structural protein [Avastrovirus 2]
MAGACPKTAGAKPKTAKPKQPKHPKKKQQPLKPREKELKHLEKQVREVKKRVAGPKSQDVMKATTTLGIVVGTENTLLSRQFRVYLNPLLMKTTIPSGTTTPLSLRASMYSLYKVLSATLRIKPLCTSANIVGSTCLASLVTNSIEATGDSIDALKARKHVDLPVGRSANWRLLPRDLAGPRRGWWLVDTSESPTDAVGCALDIHVCFQTRNLLQQGNATNVYTGPLWELELTATFSFTGYAPKPALASLGNFTVGSGTTASGTITTGTNGELVMQPQGDILEILESRATGQTTGVSEVIWAIAGSVADTASILFPQWSWLIKGGFWFIRKLFGAGRDGQSTYVIYPSLAAAMSDQRIFPSAAAAQGTSQLTMTVVHASEIMVPNPQVQAAPQTRELLTSSEFPLSDGVLPAPASFYSNTGYTPTPENLWSAAVCVSGNFELYPFKLPTTTSVGVSSVLLTGSQTYDTAYVYIFDLKKGAAFFQAGLTDSHTDIPSDTQNWNLGITSNGATFLQKMLDYPVQTTVGRIILTTLSNLSIPAWVLEKWGHLNDTARISNVRLSGRGVQSGSPTFNKLWPWGWLCATETSLFLVALPSTSASPSQTVPTEAKLPLLLELFVSHKDSTQYAIASSTRNEHWYQQPHSSVSFHEETETESEQSDSELELLPLPPPLPPKKRERPRH